MIDLIAVSVLVLLVVRGWARGFVRQALDVVTLLVGAAFAFRMAPVVGRSLTEIFGWSPELARVIGGTTLFLALSVGAGFAASAIHRSMRKLHGTSLLNSAVGAALGGIYALILAVAAVTLLAALPLPAAVASELEGSVVAERVVDPGGPAQRAVEAVSGDRAAQSMIWLRRIAGDWLFVAVDGEDLQLPISDAGDARPSARAAATLVDAVDRARSEVGLEPLRWSNDLEAIAVARAGAIYRSGSFVESLPLGERLAAAGVAATASAERLLLAPTIEGVEGAIDFAGGYDEAGIGVVDGPYGLVTVLVLTGEG